MGTLFEDWKIVVVVTTFAVGGPLKRRPKKFTDRGLKRVMTVGRHEAILEIERAKS